MKFPTYECHTFDEEGCFCVYGRSQTVKQQNQFEVKKHNLKKKRKRGSTTLYRDIFSWNQSACMETRGENDR